MTTSMRPARDSFTLGRARMWAETVRRNLPCRRSSSTDCLMASRRSGARWTSSITARSIARMKPTGSASAPFSKVASSSVRYAQSGSATFRARVVLLDCLGPLIETTGVSARASRMRDSAERWYSDASSSHEARTDRTIGILSTSIWENIYVQLGL